MAREKWSHFGLVHHEIKGLVDLGVTLLNSSLMHLQNQFLLVKLIINASIGDSVETWSFVYGVYWELVVRVLTLLILVFK